MKYLFEGERVDTGCVIEGSLVEYPNGKCRLFVVSDWDDELFSVEVIPDSLKLLESSRELEERRKRWIEKYLGSEPMRSNDRVTMNVFHPLVDMIAASLHQSGLSEEDIEGVLWLAGKRVSDIRVAATHHQIKG